MGRPPSPALSAHHQAERPHLIDNERTHPPISAHMPLFCSICGWFGGGRRVLHPVRFWVSRCLKAQNHGEQNRVQNNRVWEPAYGLTATVVEGIRFDEAADAIVVSARHNARARSRCGRCGRRSPGHDRGAGRPRWRVLDADTEAETDPRIQQESDICATSTVQRGRLVTLLFFIPAVWVFTRRDVRTHLSSVRDRIGARSH